MSKGPDLAQMRRELALHQVEVKCLRPGWQATRNNTVIITRPKLRQVVVDAYKLIVKGRS